MTNKELYNAFEILDSIADKVTGKLAYLVMYNARKIREELQEYINARNEIINRIGIKTDNGQVAIELGSPEHEVFLAEMAAYDGIELDFVPLKAKPADLYDSQLTAVDMDRISFMIDDEEDAE